MANSSGVAKRLQSELMSLMMEPLPGVSAFPDGENLQSWKGTITGSEGGVYSNMSFTLNLKFPSDYPMSPPNVTFETPIFHPNVDTAGNICLDILKDKWSATYTVSTLLLSLQGLLDTPNNDSPLNSDAAALWDNRKEYQQLIQTKYAQATNQALPSC